MSTAAASFPMPPYYESCPMPSDGDLPPLEAYYGDPLLDGRATNASGSAKVVGGGTAEPLPVVSGDRFCCDIPTWDELVERIIMLGYVYSLTGLTGHCKTALLVLLMLSVCTKQHFGPHPLKTGKVLYLCGENPVDAQLRFAVLLQALGLQADALKNSLVVVPAAFHLEERLPDIRGLASRLGPFVLVVVDTSVAYFSYGDENNNLDARNHAADCRSLTTINGNPAVIVAAHPTKGAGKDNLLPRGGGAFLNEVDGNLTVWRDGETVALHHAGKFRGSPFDPVTFKLEQADIIGVTRKDGRPHRSVFLQWIDDTEAAKLDTGRIQDENRLLWALLHYPNGTFSDWASACGWKGKGKVSRALEALSADHLVKKYRGRYTLTDAGKREAEKDKK